MRAAFEFERLVHGHLVQDVVDRILGYLDAADSRDRRTLFSCLFVSAPYLSAAARMLWSARAVLVIRRGILDVATPDKDTAAVAVNPVIELRGVDIDSGDRRAWRWGVYLGAVRRMVLSLHDGREAWAVSDLGPWLRRIDEVEVVMGDPADPWFGWLKGRWTAGDGPSNVQLWGTPVKLAHAILANRSVKKVTIDDVFMRPTGMQYVMDVLEGVRHVLDEITIGRVDPFMVGDGECLFRKVKSRARLVNLYITDGHVTFPDGFPLTSLTVHKGMSGSHYRQMNLNAVSMNLRKLVIDLSAPNPGRNGRYLPSRTANVFEPLASLTSCVHLKVLWRHVNLTHLLTALPVMTWLETLHLDFDSHLRVDFPTLLQDLVKLTELSIKFHMVALYDAATALIGPGHWEEVKARLSSKYKRVVIENGTLEVCAEAVSRAGLPVLEFMDVTRLSSVQGNVDVGILRDLMADKEIAPHLKIFSIRSLCEVAPAALPKRTRVQDKSLGTAKATPTKKSTTKTPAKKSWREKYGMIEGENISSAAATARTESTSTCNTMTDPRASPLSSVEEFKREKRKRQRARGAADMVRRITFAGWGRRAAKAQKNMKVREERDERVFAQQWLDMAAAMSPPDGDERGTERVIEPGWEDPKVEWRRRLSTMAAEVRDTPAAASMAPESKFVAESAFSSLLDGLSADGGANSRDLTPTIRNMICQAALKLVTSFPRTSATAPVTFQLAVFRRVAASFVAAAAFLGGATWRNAAQDAALAIGVKVEKAAARRAVAGTDRRLDVASNEQTPAIGRNVEEIPVQRKVGEEENVACIGTGNADTASPRPRTPGSESSPTSPSARASPRTRLDAQASSVDAGGCNEVMKGATRITTAETTPRQTCTVHASSAPSSPIMRASRRAPRSTSVGSMKFAPGAIRHRTALSPTPDQQATSYASPPASAAHAQDGNRCRSPSAPASAVTIATRLRRRSASMDGRVETAQFLQTLPPTQVTNIDAPSSALESTACGLTPLTVAPGSNSKYKTRECRYARKPAGCRRGLNCPFLHPEDVVNRIRFPVNHPTARLKHQFCKVETADLLEAKRNATPLTTASAILPNLLMPGASRVPSSPLFICHQLPCACLNSDDTTRHVRAEPLASATKNSVTSASATRPGPPQRIHRSTPPSSFPKYKTRQCRYAYSSAGCSRGKSCNFLHPEDLRGQERAMWEYAHPSAVPVNPIASAPAILTPACRYFLRGNCWYGESCRFSHDVVHHATAGPWGVWAVPEPAEAGDQNEADKDNGDEGDRRVRDVMAERRRARDLRAKSTIVRLSTIARSVQSVRACIVERAGRTKVQVEWAESAVTLVEA
ncbi:hypothetical protein HK101_010934 [Irineochytrium annulatum]|nr:hypothetical protein HK101_010934 [Irineochytrium annulatum]